MYYKYLLHPTDLSSNHFSLCEQAKKLADAHQAKLALLHVINIPQSLLLAQNLGFASLMKPAKEDALTVMKTLGEALSIPQSQLFVEVGVAKHQILDAAQRLHCDLIVLGRHAAQGFVPLIGSTTYEVMQHAPCDVLTLSNLHHDKTSVSKKKAGDL